MLFALPTDTRKIYPKKHYASLLQHRDVTQPRSFRHREHLPAKGIWRIESGYVRSITWDETGTVSALGIWGTGDVVGHPLSNIEPYQIECLTPVLTREIVLSSDFIPLLLSHIQQMEVLLDLVHVKQVSERLMRLLEWLTQRFGKLNEQGCVIDVPLTHQSIADLIGSTRVTVTRLLNQLERTGQIQQLRQHRILLRNVVNI
ncbi:MAG: Crp/Fnr family transcriptional regulator [Leptolyngbya sp. Prado105]|jgi:CRP-like cAMP-binding protein|nr:Crp/Fnr family transcriptional regulator [Leptolyngbya sp. Prado105]